MRTHQLEERKREECIHELGNVAHHRGLTDWRGGRGRSTFMSSETWQVTNEDSPTGGEEEGRSAFVSLETWHITNEDSLTGGEGEEHIRELRNMARHRRLTRRRGGRRSAFMSSETWHIANENSLAGGEDEG